MAGLWFENFELCSCGCGVAVVTAPDTRIYQLHTCHSPGNGDAVSFNAPEPANYPAPLWLPDEVPS